MADRVGQIDADAVIGEEYEAFKGDVVRTVSGKLAASKIRFAELDMDGFYNQAWYGLYTKLQDGQAIENRKGLLVQMTYRRAIDEYRTLHPDRQADPVVLETVGVEDPIAETLDQQRDFSQFVEAMRSSLSQRELTAATLCYVYGMTRPEAAEQIGVRPKRMEKIMDEVSVKMRPLLSSIKEGNWCEDRAVLINQYALGALEPGSDEHEQAVRHLEQCPGCRRHVLGTRGLAAVTIPSTLALVALTGAATGGAAVAASAATSGGSTSAGNSSGLGGAAQVAAIVAAIAAVAVGGSFVIKNVSGGDEQPAATPAAAPAPSTKAESDSSASPSSSSESSDAAESSTKAKSKPEPASAPAPSTTQSQPPAQPATPAAPSAPEPTPENPSKDSGAEFELQ